MELKVSYASGSPLTLQVEPDESVDNIKRRIQTVTQLSPDSMTLWACDIELEDDHRLADYAEAAGDGLLLIPDLRKVMATQLAARIESLRPLTSARRSIPSGQAQEGESRESDESLANFSKYVAALDKLLGRYYYTELEACTMYADPSREKMIHEYVGSLENKKKLTSFAIKVYEQLASCDATAKILSESLINGADSVEAVLETLQSSNLCAHVLITGCLEQFRHCSHQGDFVDFWNKWKDQVDLSIDLLNFQSMKPVIWDDVCMKSFQRNLSKARSCCDESFMEYVIDKVNFLERQGLILPYATVCAPPGAGKTTLAYNLARYSFPTLYFVLNCDKNSCQATSTPFQSLSEALNAAITADMLYIANVEDLVPELFGMNVFYRTATPKCLKTVHFIVEWFSEVCEIKSKFPQASWLEAQAAITHLY